jgi:hypothetical protein
MFTLTKPHHHLLEVAAIVLPQLLRQRIGHIETGLHVAVVGHILHHLRNPVLVFEIPVIGKLVMDPKAH